MTDKGLNLFDESAAECEHLHAQKEKCNYSKFTERQRMPTKINKNGAVAKVRILVELGMLYVVLCLIN